MKSVLKSLLILALVALVAAPLSAEEPKKKKPQRDAAPQAVSAMMNKLKAVDLTEEQQGQLKELAAKFGPKFKECQGKMTEILGPEARKAMAAAMKKAREEGKKGKELQEARLAALNLDADKKEELDKCQAAQRELQGEFVAAVKEILTPEQVEKAGLKGRKGKAAAKNPAKKPAKGKAKLPGNPKSESAKKPVE